MAEAAANTISNFDACVAQHEGGTLDGIDLDTIQLNIGLTCNLACRHCHVSSGPKRTEQMNWKTGEAVLRVARLAGARLIDITGGAPEMNPHFRRFVAAARAQGHAIQVRTNLTIFFEDGYEDLPQFFREHRVALVASLPCYTAANVDRQRGDGVFDGSVRALQLLNAEGYGLRDDLPLHLVYNPLGPSLPPPQAQLEQDYRRELDRLFGIRFTDLFAIANMPIGRFLGDLRTQGKETAYMDRLRGAFNPGTLVGLMCRHQLNVDWNGALFDCDFNLALKMGVADGLPRNVRELDTPEAVEAFRRRRIVTAPHCFGCTAGSGSSCGGALL
jgi:radical SAM/Cys-rich protein